MQRAIVTAVSGSRICANGRWLTAIGNKTFRPGDAVWTDGRCVYGKVQDSGGMALIISDNEPYVPIFMSDGTRALYHKGKITKYEKGQRHKLMVNRGHSFTFADGKVLDLHLDEQDNQYELQPGDYTWHDIGDGEIDEYQIAQPEVIRNGQMEHIIDLGRYSSFCYDYAYEEAMVIETPLSGVDDEINKVYEKSCTLVNGWYESEDSYCYLLSCYAKGFHIDAINYRGDGEADWGFFIDFISYMWVMVTSKSVQPLWAMTVRDVNEDDESLPIERDRFRIYAGNFTLPLPDGYYIEGSKVLPNKPMEYNWWNIFSGKLYSPQKKLIYEHEFNLRKPIRLGRVKKGKWLMSLGDELGIIKGGKWELLSHDVYNSRLRPMKNRRNWMKGE